MPSANDYKVVKFKNSTDFDFTHDMGCMYNSVPISGVQGVLGIKSGEEMTLPYHVGNRLSVNLAKAVMVRSDDGKPLKDANGNPMADKAIWSEPQLDATAKSFITELYKETAPLALTETDKLLAKVEEFKSQMKKQGIDLDAPESAESVAAVKGFKDKKDVLDELTRRGIVHDKRKSKAELEKLLA